MRIPSSVYITVLVSALLSFSLFAGYRMYMLEGLQQEFEILQNENDHQHALLDGYAALARWDGKAAIEHFMYAKDRNALEKDVQDAFSILGIFANHSPAWAEVLIQADDLPLVGVRAPGFMESTFQSLLTAEFKYGVNPDWGVLQPFALHLHGAERGGDENDRFPEVIKLMRSVSERTPERVLEGLGIEGREPHHYGLDVAALGSYFALAGALDAFADLREQTATYSRRSGDYVALNLAAMTEWVARVEAKASEAELRVLLKDFEAQGIDLHELRALLTSTRELSAMRGSLRSEENLTRYIAALDHLQEAAEAERTRVE